MKKFYITTFGCQMNEHDSEIMSGILTANDYEETTVIDDADVILLNTCCIREKAENKVLSYLGELKHLAKEKPDLIIGVCGCMTQQQDIIPKILKAAPFVNLIFGTLNMYRLMEFIDKIHETGEPIYEISDQPEEPSSFLPAKRMYPFKAFVNIIFGCNNFCTYCIVPHVRGRERSRSMDEILTEIKRLAEDGVVEVTLLGQNVNSYGNDLQDGSSFPVLLEKIAEIPGIKRIRFMTSHPKDLSDELIDVIAKHEKISRHIHLPVQSGSNRTLERMNRKYTRESYLALVEKIRDKIPGAAITTDIIVGFPGETEEDFADTLDLVKQVNYDSAFAFIYSPRKGTPAAEWDNKITLEEKKKRLQAVNQILATSSNMHNQEYLHKTVKVLVDGVSKNNEGILQGRTDTFKNVYFHGDKNLIGTFQDVEITEVKSWHLFGTLK